MPSAHVLDVHAPAEAPRSLRSLRIIWQDEASRRFIHVATLDQVESDTFVFHYEEGARHENFEPLAEFPKLERTYSVNRLPAFFSNRVMSPRRASYPTYCGWLGLSEITTPVEILARNGGGRVTDTFHVVDGFEPVAGHVEGHFLASGVRYFENNRSLSRIGKGDRLRLVPEPDNAANPGAVLLGDAHGAPVGYVPDWLLGDVRGWGLPNTAVHVGQVNTEAPAHLRLLCRIEANLPQS
ncbi:hypothetical protein [uncultured Propionibacterium sp.]|uniref:hypothetical protein n=1 Tax=uncultured Propionibacterium sp. TaxID=218066 RepID=UPI0029300A60|nr:hypothetical protein [uncultured Propionibacterium sp.]